MLKKLLNEKKISAYSLSKKSGVPYSTVSDLINGKTDIGRISADTLYAISKSLGVSMETLYLGNNLKESCYLYNDGRQIYVECLGNIMQFMGPKNLLAFKQVNKFKDGCISVEAFFKDKDNRIYVEEDYVDLVDVFADYDMKLPDGLVIHIGKPGADRTDSIIDQSIIVSDNLAVIEKAVSTDDIVVEIINMTRQNSRMVLRLKDYAILSSNMSERMQKRALSMVKRNEPLIAVFAEEGQHGA